MSGVNCSDCGGDAVTGHVGPGPVSEFVSELQRAARESGLSDREIANLVAEMRRKHAGDTAPGPNPNTFTVSATSSEMLQLALGPPRQPPTVTCSCGRPFKTAQGYRRHRRDYHGEKADV